MAVEIMEILMVVMEVNQKQKRKDAVECDNLLFRKIYLCLYY